MSVFICPVCGENLEISGKSYVCKRNHCFDTAKSGYVNLLPSGNSGKSVHGDNKLMVRARREFLDRGYYAPLKDALCESVVSYYRDGTSLLDAGCGEGYYTSAVAESLENSGKRAEIYGIDVSKTAVDYAAKKCRNVSFAAASVFHIPAADNSFSMLVTLFAPYCGNEYRRVLDDDGIMIMAIPSVMHLWELKQAIYDVPYKNEVKPYELDGFKFIENKHITYSITLNSQEDIQSLFSMTPYYYRTGKREQERLNSFENLETQVDFELLVYNKF
jgi:23S rRNA (guanine745-N1)-methyltransferase